MGEVNPVILRSYVNTQGQNNAPIDVAGVTVVRSFTLPAKQDAAFGYLFQFASSGIVEVQIDFEQGNVLPATEKAADPNYVLPENADPVVIVNDTLVHIVAFSPVVTRFTRLLLTGTGANDASTQLIKGELTYARI